MDFTDKIEFKLKAMSKGLSAENIHILILQEKNGSVVFPLPVSEEQNRMVAATANTVSNMSSLMESVRMTIAETGAILEGVSIDFIANGEYRAHLFVNTNGEESTVSVNAANAIVMALSFRIPLYVSEKLLQGTRADMKKQAFTFPIATLSAEVLKSALEDAIEKEQYEIAAFLRDELKKRK